MAWFFRRRRTSPQQKSSPVVSFAPTYQSHLPPMGGERRFREDMPYVLPKDLDEENRLDFQHFALRSALKGNFFAPVKHPASILDVGCGSGIWADEIGQQFPSACVIGLDLEKPVKPGRYEFVQGNVLQRLPFDDNQFDFVHQRLLIGAIPATAWPEVLLELARVTKPGGWLELLESDGTGFHPAGPRTQEITSQVIKLAARRGIDTTITSSLDLLLANAGLHYVQRQNFPLPVGQWGGRLGSLMLTDMIAIERSFKDGFVALLGYKPNQFDALLNAVINEWEQYHSQYVFYCFNARKKM